MATPNLAIAHIAAAQNQPEVTANDAFDQLDDSVNLLVSIALSDADTTLTQAQLASGGALKFTGTLTANRHLNLPASVGRLFLIDNATTGGYSLIVQVTGAPGTTVTVTTSAGLILLYSDGTNVTEVSGAGGGSSPNFADGVTPTGSCNGSNTSFGLSNSPSPVGSLLLVQRTGIGVGVVLFAGLDYTLAGAAITMSNPPANGDTLRAWYRY